MLNDGWELANIVVGVESVVAKMIKMVFSPPDFISSAAFNIFFLVKCLQTLLVKKVIHHNPVELKNAVMTISWNDEMMIHLN